MKKDLIVDQYFSKTNGFTNTMAMVSNPIPDDELINFFYFILLEMGFSRPLHQLMHTAFLLKQE
jgi:hypothetical protein